jgi:hypothetical protein
VNEPARIRVLSCRFGPHPESQPLNPRFRPDSSRLQLALDIEWEPRDAVAALARLEQELAAVCPSLAAHDCGGTGAYRILRAREATAGAPDFEAPLALAHLLEHVLIDAVAAVSGEPRVSGATGARRDAARRFDLFVECPDAALVPPLVRLALAWLAAGLDGGGLDGAGGPVLDVLRRLYRQPTHSLAVGELTPGAGSDRVAAALAWLEAQGLVQRRGGRVRLHAAPLEEGARPAD